LARINYQHGKRLRELAKKQKREEKIQKRLERQRTGIAGEAPEGETPAGEEPAPNPDETPAPTE
jgi:hypothetical protein